MTATAFLQSNPELIDSLAELLSSKFDISPDLLKTITQKAVATSTRKTNILVEKSLKEKLKDIDSSFGGVLNNITKIFKESGLIGLGKQFKNYVKTLFTPTKEKIIPEFSTKTDSTKEKNIPESSTTTTTEEKNVSAAPSVSTTADKETPNLPVIIPQGVQSLAADKSESEADRKYTEETKKEAIPVLLAGITPEGEVNLKEKLPGIFEDIFKKLPKQEQKQDLQQRFSEKGLLGILPKGLLAMGGGLALLLGGIAALVTGLQSDGPFKGLLKIFSNVGITGGLKLLEKGAKTFINTLKSFIDAPIKLLDNVGTGLKGVLSSLMPKGLKSVVKSTASIFSRMLGGLVKFLAPILKKLPLIGTVISWGFAYTRFKSGDVVGGIIDVLSGIANIFAIIPGFGLIGTGIAIGLDVLNAFLDYKAGGSSKEASAKKTGIITDWIKGLGKWIYNTLKKIPLINRIIKTGELLFQKKWIEGLVSFTRIIPGVGWIMDLLGFTEDKQVQDVEKGFDAIKNLWKWIKDSLWEKVTGFVGSLIDSVKNWWNNLSWNPASWIGLGPEISEPSSTPKQTTTVSSTPLKTEQLVKPSLASTTPTSTTEPVLSQTTAATTQASTTPASTPVPTIQPTPTLEPAIPMAEGGIVTAPTNALIGEAGPEAVLPLDEMFKDLFSGKNSDLNNKTLESIASNTNDTNSALTNLSNAIYKLAQTFAKQQSNGNNIIINGQQQSGNYPSASQVASSNVDPIRQIRSQFAI